MALGIGMTSGGFFDSWGRLQFLSRGWFGDMDACSDRGFRWNEIVIMLVHMLL